jgi:hypothetical protein
MYTRQCLGRTGPVMQQHRQVGPGTGGQGDLPVHARGVTAGVVLAHPPHADQRVGSTAQHQLLQIADLFVVARLRRLEDPLP